MTANRTPTIIDRARAAERLSELQRGARDAAIALDPGELGAARSTRHSFARSMLRRAASEGWQVAREHFDVDGDGRGVAVYRVDFDDADQVRLVAFPTVIDDSERTDRVIAQSWDLTAALCRGVVDGDRLERLQSEVPNQETGRADRGTVVWARANRSARFFEHVVARLASGRQPAPDVIGDDAYLMRSTAFYGNGKWGLADFEGEPADARLAVPYRAQMLTAWLIRELSLDLVEHCARHRGADAVTLDDRWRRYFGLGNATGLGMVPYVINHPQVLDAWVAARELPLANALGSTWTPESAEADRVVELLDRAVEHFAQRSTLSTAPYPQGPELAANLETIAAFARDRAVDGVAGFARVLHDRAAHLDIETRSVVDSILVELDDRLDEQIESALRRDEQLTTNLAVTCEELRLLIEGAYNWITVFDFDEPAESARFWFLSEDSQEPRRGRRGANQGEHVEMAIDVARRVQRLHDALRIAPNEETLAEFLFDHPAHRWAIDRVSTVHALVYGEAHINPLSDDFLPLDLQRFQLAMYGMENFSPQSTDWLRVTLFAGAPRVADVNQAVDDDWCFVIRPTDNNNGESE